MKNLRNGLQPMTYTNILQGGGTRKKNFSDFCGPPKKGKRFKSKLKVNISQNDFSLKNKKK